MKIKLDDGAAEKVVQKSLKRWRKMLKGFRGTNMAEADHEAIIMAIGIILDYCWVPDEPK
jgi:hypothetical protein